MTVTAITSHPNFRRAPAQLVFRRQLEQLLGIGRTAVFELIKEGLPVAERSAAGHRFDVDECLTWLAAHGYSELLGSVARGYANPPQGVSYA